MSESHRTRTDEIIISAVVSSGPNGAGTRKQERAEVHGAFFRLVLNGFDRDAGNGQGVTIGRLRPDNMFDWRFVALSHNTVRGAAGGAVLTAELLSADGYLAAK